MPSAFFSDVTEKTQTGLFPRPGLIVHHLPAGLYGKVVMDIALQLFRVEGSEKDPQSARLKMSFFESSSNSDAEWFGEGNPALEVHG